MSETDWPPVEPTDATAVGERRDEVVRAVRDHAGRVAGELARLEGGDYGRVRLDTDRGSWTLKYEGGDCAYLLFEPRRGEDVYVVSTKRPPAPEPLAAALADYDAFVRAVNERIAAAGDVLDGALDEVRFPEVASTDAVAGERDRILGRVRDACDRMAGELNRVDADDYGTFAVRVSGTRWELKWEGDRASYLRAGGAGGVYLLSQYGPPAAADVRTYAPQFPAVVEAFNGHVADLEADLRTVRLGDDGDGDGDGDAGAD